VKPLLLTLFLPLFALSQDPAPLAWKFAAGDTFKIRVRIERDATLGSAKNPIRTESEVTVNLAMTVTETTPDGAKLRLTFTSIDGNLTFAGINNPIHQTANALEAKTVDATLSPRGVLTCDADQIAAVLKAPDLSEDFTELFPVLPEAAVKEGDAWKHKAGERDEDFTIDSLSPTGARFSGKASADSKADIPDLKTALKSEGVMSGVFDVEKGHLAIYEMERSDESTLENTKKGTKLETKVRIKRTVEISRAQK
jgi:hypothetical protein